MTGKPPLELFWWSPWRTPRAAVWELRRNGGAWVSMAARGGRPLQNFGDELSRRVVEEVTHRRVKWAPPGTADATAIGSVVEHVAAADGGGMIWGTGLRRPEFPPSAWALRDSSRFLAVRGTLTRDALGLPADVPLGDPGLVVRAFVQRSPRTAGVVVVPHFLAFNSAEARHQMAAARSYGLRIVPPSAGWERVCEEVSRADLVLSSSLHGMVIADALSRPVQLVSFGATAEPPFKFIDYQSVFGLSSEFVSFAGVVADGKTESVLSAAEKRSETVSLHLDDVVERLVRSADALADLR